MTDLGTADNVYVCGPDCKAIAATEEQVDPGMSWWEKLLTIALSTIIVVCATVGALDIGVRMALHYWNF